MAYHGSRPELRDTPSSEDNQTRHNRTADPSNPCLDGETAWESTIVVGGPPIRVRVAEQGQSGTRHHRVLWQSFPKNEAVLGGIGAQTFADSGAAARC